MKSLGTLDVSILVMRNGDPEVKAVTGEAHLGLIQNFNLK